MWAACEGHLEVLDLLLAKDISAEHVGANDNTYGSTALVRFGCSALPCLNRVQCTYLIFSSTTLRTTGLLPAFAGCCH